MAGVGYIRREIDAGEVKFIVAQIPSGTLSIPVGAAALFLYVVSKVFPSLPAVITVAGAVFLFYRLRTGIKQRALDAGEVFIASPTGLVTGDSTIPRALIQQVAWTDSSPHSPFSDSEARHWMTSVTVETASGPWITVGSRMEAGTAQQLANALVRALGDVPVSGGRERSAAGEL